MSCGVEGGVIHALKRTHSNQKMASKTLIIFLFIGILLGSLPYGK